VFTCDEEMNDMHPHQSDVMDHNNDDNADDNNNDDNDDEIEEESSLREDIDFELSLIDRREDIDSAHRLTMSEKGDNNVTNNGSSNPVVSFASLDPLSPSTHTELSSSFSSPSSSSLPTSSSSSSLKTIETVGEDENMAAESLASMATEEGLGLSAYLYLLTTAFDASGNDFMLENS